MTGFLHRITFLLGFGLFSHTGYSQKTVAEVNTKLSGRIDEVSYFWKLDSLGSNGARYFSSEMLIKAPIDKVSFELLLEKLGKPNEIWRGDQIWAIYYVYDPRRMPGLTYPVLMYFLVYFKVDRSSMMVVSSGWDHVDL